MIDREQPWMFAVAGPALLETVEDVPLVSGLAARVISRGADGACTLELAPARGVAIDAALHGRLDIFVLDGELAVGGERLVGGGFATLPLGEAALSAPGEAPVRAIVIWQPGGSARPDGSRPHIASAWDRSWETNTQPGTPFGLMRRRLREDEAGPPPGPPGGWVRAGARRSRLVHRGRGAPRRLLGGEHPPARRRLHG